MVWPEVDANGDDTVLGRRPLQNAPTAMGAVSAQIAPGTLIAGRYLVGELIGVGGMGRVYDAMHAETRRRIALKVLSFGDAEAEIQLGRFAREARALGQVRSPHVVEVYDAGVAVEQGAPFMAMEYLQGVDTAAILDAFGPLPFETVRRVGLQALRGLVAAHAAGVVHRDIKPANVFVVSAGDARIIKLLDFGIARLAGSSSSDLTQDLTKQGAFVGSPPYMAPEQVRGFRDTDGRVDVWALSVTLYKLLAGRTPHVVGDDDGVGNLFVKICGEPAPRLETFAPWVPRALCDVIHRGLAIDVEARHPTAQALLDDMEALGDPDATTLSSADFRALTTAERERTWAETPMDVVGRPPNRAQQRGIRRLKPLLAVVLSAAVFGSLGLAASPTKELPSTAIPVSAGAAPPSATFASTVASAPQAGLRDGTPPPSIRGAERALARPGPQRPEPAASAVPIPREIATTFGD